MKCHTCHRDREESEMVHDVFTEEEREHVRQETGIDTDGPWYCKPCFAVLSDRQAGAQFLKGLLQLNLASVGVGNADSIAQKFHDELLKLPTKPKDT